MAHPGSANHCGSWPVTERGVFPFDVSGSKIAGDYADTCGYPFIVELREFQEAIGRLATFVGLTMTILPGSPEEGLPGSRLNLIHRKAVTGCAVLSGCILALDSMTPLGIADGMLYPLVIVFASLSGRSLLIATFATLDTALILVGWSLSASGASESTVAINRIMAMAAVWIVAGTSIVRVRKVAAAASAQRDVEAIQGKLMILHGLATVCPGCKRVRNRDGLWLELTTYCQEQSDAELSCSICDHCAQRHWWQRLTGARRRRSSRT